MVRIFLLLAVLFLIGLLIAKYILPLIFNKLKDDVRTIKSKLKDDSVIDLKTKK